MAKGMTTMAVVEMVPAVDRITEVFDLAGHPVRLRVLMMLGDTGRLALSPREMTDMLNERAVREAEPRASETRVAALVKQRRTDGLGFTLGTVSYHVRVLDDAKQIKLKRTGQVRGAIAHFYVLSPEGRKLYKKLLALAGRFDG